MEAKYHAPQAALPRKLTFFANVQKVAKKQLLVSEVGEWEKLGEDLAWNGHQRNQNALTSPLKVATFQEPYPKMPLWGVRNFGGGLG